MLEQTSAQVAAPNRAFPHQEITIFKEPIQRKAPKRFTTRCSARSGMELLSIFNMSKRSL